jgi:hypothetical protein
MKKNVIGKYVYTAKEYTQEFPNMRNGDTSRSKIRID